jgi:hypothetical protein
VVPAGPASRTAPTSRDPVARAPHALGVVGEAVGVHDRLPLAGRSPVEESAVVLPEAVDLHLGGELVGPPLHVRERGRCDERGPDAFVDGDPQGGGEAPHLPVEVGLEVGVVEHDHVRVFAVLPERVEMVERAAETAELLLDGGVVVDPRPEALDGIVRPGRRAVGHQLGEVIEPHGGRPCADDGIDVHVLGVVVPRQPDITGVAPDADVGDPLVVGQPVERGVALDEPPVRLPGEGREDVLDGVGLHVDPGRQLGERSGEVRVLEDQERADHLHPGSAGLGRCRDDDVVVAELEPLPASAVPDDRPVSLWCLVHRVSLCSAGDSPAPTVAGPQLGRAAWNGHLSCRAWDC